MAGTPLRETFDTAAARYHRARPGYPEELFDDLIQLATLGSEARILEIGPGTGKATEPLARRGFTIHGIELGPALADEARRNLADYPNVRIDVGAFETFPLAPASYDLVMSATAFHWIEQPLGYQRVAEALQPGGHFAEFRHHHVWSPEWDDFFRESQALYQKYMPGTPPDFRLPLAEEVPTLEHEIVASGLFEPPAVRRYFQKVTHTPQSYADLLLTFSNHIALPEPDRSLLIGGLSELIRQIPGGRIVKTLLVILHVARAKPQS